jgi:type IV fimbrial biogenesis protein FimT
MFSLTDGLRLTRNEAIRRNGRVVMCKTGDGLQCTKEGDWSQGWIIFHDTNNSGDVSAGEVILFREAPATNGIQITGNQTVDAYISYTSYGKAKQLRGGFQAGTLTVCHRTNATKDAYLVIFGKSGRPRVQKTVLDQCK